MLGQTAISLKVLPIIFSSRLLPATHALCGSEPGHSLAVRGQAAPDGGAEVVGRYGSHRHQLPGLECAWIWHRKPVPWGLSDVVSITSKTGRVHFIAVSHRLL